MQRDIRETPLYQQAEAFFRTLRQPGTGQISDAASAHVAPDGRAVVFAGTIVDSFEGMPPTRICLTDLEAGSTRVLTFGPNVDRSPKYSPDGRQIAFLSDRHEGGNYQLYLLDPITGAARSTAAVKGWIEYLHWSPDGRRILLGVAAHGADVAGGQGGVASKRISNEVPAWMPSVEAGDESHRWRSAWVYELASNSVRQLSLPGVNVWEAAWCGNERIAAVVSPNPGEGLWYSAQLQIIDSATGAGRTAYSPRDQLGWPSGAPSGNRVAVVEAVCSDRGLVAGALLLIETGSGQTRRVDTRGVDITHTEWRSDRKLLLAGHRGFETVIGLCDAEAGTFREIWKSEDLSTGGLFVTVSGINEEGDCVLVGESFTRPPEIAVIRRGVYQAVRSFGLDGGQLADTVGGIERLTWNAPDGLEIQGWLLRPKGKGPYPLILNIHGGPVWLWRPTWPGRASGPSNFMLAERGYAVLFANPRGSVGRGQEFTRGVVGDMGGADMHDLLSGIDYLVKRGVADPRRLGVRGGSYGGYMAAWLITQDSRFAAAVANSPVINYVTEHLVSNIPHFVRLFLADTYINTQGKYFSRSPVMYAHKARTPTLNVCGALDRCTPPEEAVQFHNALLENGVRSVLLTYPEEGHGVRRFPAVIDYAARIVSWFEEHMPARSGASL